MRFDPPLLSGRLVQRYKRFLADVILDDGTELTVHCPNPGAMLGLNAPGIQVWLSKSLNENRKLPYTWELAEIPKGPAGEFVTVGINTMAPNRLVAEALAINALPELSGFTSVRREVNYGKASRIDFLLETPQNTCAPNGDGDIDSNRPSERLWLEVKNCHLLRQDDLAEFPDCIAARSVKHLRELESMVAAGDRAAVLFVVQRTDCGAFSACYDIDPVFAHQLDHAADVGVEVYVYGCSVSSKGVVLKAPLPWRRR